MVRLLWVRLADRLEAIDFHEGVCYRFMEINLPVMAALALIGLRPVNEILRPATPTAGMLRSIGQERSGAR